MSIGSFTLIKNESIWIGPHIMAWLPYLDEMSFFDGNSTDGTLEIMRRIKNTHADGHKLRIFEDKDPADLCEDYVRLFDACMRTLNTDLALFLHPDMWPANPEKISEFKNDPDMVAGSVEMESYAGEPGGQLLRVLGRGERWKNIYRLRNPDLGAHYHGFYGAQNEDVYFREITGDAHEHYGQDMDRYPYPVKNTGLRVLHFSDVRPYSRRLDRMTKCLVNQGYSRADAENIAPLHPRVSLKDGGGIKFCRGKYPDQFLLWSSEFAGLKRQPACA